MKAGNVIFDMVDNSVKILVTVFTFVFSIACGLLLVRYLIPGYFKLFSPIPETLTIFYIAVSVFVLLVILFDIRFLKKGRYNWAVWFFGAAISLLFFGIPIFMLDNNEMLWREAVLTRSGPVYFVEFSEYCVLTLKYFQNLYELIWYEMYLYIYASVVVYLAAYFSLWKMGWRIGRVRIK